MTQLTITPSGPVSGEISIPGDKSVTHRAVIFGAMAEGTSIIRDYCDGEDCLHTIRAIQALGIPIEITQSELRILGKGLWGFSEPQQIIDCGNSGTSMRLLAGLLSGQSFFSILTGDTSLRNRPMGRIVNPLRQMGATIGGRNKGALSPLAIQGSPLQGISYDSSISSAQVKSGILIAGLLAKGTTTFHEPASSRDHTEKLLKYFGGRLTRKDPTTVSLEPSTLTSHDVKVPGDFSSAAFFLVAALILPGSNLTIRNVGLNTTRVGLLEILCKMGASIQTSNVHETSGELTGDLNVKSSTLTGIDVDPNDMLRAIDEFPILCVAASFAKGKTRISGMKELRVKESDRIATMTEVLMRLGVEVDEQPDGLILQGTSSLQGAECPSYGDHRIAMSMAIAGLHASQTTIVTNIDCIQTSFPTFIDKLQSIAPSCKIETICNA